MFAYSILSLMSIAAASSLSYSTEVVQSYTTYLSEPTTLVENDQTYTVTGPTNLTVTDCPCTRTHTFSTRTVTACSSGDSSKNNTIALAENTSGAGGSVPGLSNGGSKQAINFALGVAAAALLI